MKCHDVENAQVRKARRHRTEILFKYADTNIEFKYSMQAREYRPQIDGGSEKSSAGRIR
jgi:hypothetical protein